MYTASRWQMLSRRLLNDPSNVLYDEEMIPVFARWIGSWRISLQRRALSSPQLTRFYDVAAPRWSQKLDQLGYPDAYDTLLRSVMSEAEPLGAIGAQIHVLDCGVGTGALSCALARVLPAPFKLDSIDVSPGMLERASTHLRDTGLEVSLRHGDVRRLPYGDGVFDLVMTAHVLEHLVDPIASQRDERRTAGSYRSTDSRTGLWSGHGRTFMRTRPRVTCPFQARQHRCFTWYARAGKHASSHCAQ